MSRAARALGPSCTTAAWLTPAFASRDVDTSGTLWAWNAFVHVLMVAGVVTLLLVPQLERWVDRHVMSG